MIFSSTVAYWFIDVCARVGGDLWARLVSRTTEGQRERSKEEVHMVLLAASRGKLIHPAIKFVYGVTVYLFLP